MIANDAKIDGARRQRSELGRHGHARQYIESLFLQVANARRKAEAQQTAHGKDMIGEAPGVGVVFVNDKAALVIKQSVEDIGRLVSGRLIGWKLGTSLAAPLVREAFSPGELGT